MTDDAECIEYLLSRCPGFSPHWRAHRALYGDEPTPGGLMLDLAAFGRYVADAIERDDATELAAIAEAVERLVDWPSDHIQAAAIYGLLEGLTNRCLGEAERYPFQRLARYLGPSAIAPPAEILTISGALKRQACEHMVRALGYAGHSAARSTQAREVAWQTTD